jgi:hypothetical protein
MPWRAGNLGSILGGTADPGRLSTLERHFWLELWRVPVVEAVEEMGIEARLYGPVLALAVADLPRTPILNLILGAGDAGAVEEGHLEEALDWIEGFGVDCRIPIGARAPQAGAAEDLLNRRGYRRGGTLARFVRQSGPPGFPPPPGIEVRELTEFSEGFGQFIGEGLELELPGQGFFDGLPGRPRWRSYFAIDARERPVAAATMMIHYEVAQLGFAATCEEDRRRGAHMALLHRRILDATAARSRTLFADTEEPLEDPESPSPAARNLARAGFAQVAERTVWRPAPESLVEPDPPFAL